MLNVTELLPVGIISRVFPLLMLALLPACQSTTGDIIPSLGELDVKKTVILDQSKVIPAKTQQQIRQAYASYLENASVQDNSRLTALNRLAELEFIYSNKILASQENQEYQDENIDNAVYQARLDKTIQLLDTALKDYPKAENNDKIMYQLARALDLKGRHEESMDTLNQLVEQYPNSHYYQEVQFRIAEDAFTVQDYSTAEYAYSEVIASSGNDIFYEKSLFKRGWSRFKQEFYKDAIDDFLRAVIIHNFDQYEKLNKAEKEQFDEYFRAVALSFSYLGGSAALNDYFNSQRDFKYIYYSYSRLSNIYLKQERYSDAVDALQQFIEQFPQSAEIPYSKLKIIEIWQTSGFSQQIYDAIEDFYRRYNPASQYWKDQNENSRINRIIRRSLKKYIILMAGYYHNRYQQSSSEKDYQTTETWYQRYLQHYRAYAQNDKIYFLYGELLNQHNNFSEALKYYELAAFENSLIINKDAAYAAIVTTDNLLKKFPENTGYLRKHIDYALKYASEYPDSERSQHLIVHAAELAFDAGEYKNTIELADIKFNKKPLSDDIYLASLKTESYFKLHDYVEAEKLYQQMLQADTLSTKQQLNFKNGLAVAIYQQAKVAEQDNQLQQAIHHFSRISKRVPQSSIASTGLYDAIALNMQHQQWKTAINEIDRFQTLYPHHKLLPEVRKKLSVAYLKSDQGIKAAREFEKISGSSNDQATKAAALWQAAELYKQKEQFSDAIRAYEKYAKNYNQSFEQYLEALNSLSDLNLLTGSAKKSTQWRQKIISADNRALNNTKTKRTRNIVTNAYLTLARDDLHRFDQLKLSLPLNKSLQRKKQAMQSAIKLFGKSSLYQDYAATTEATYSIATIYKDFSKALLDSERPTGLTDEEFDQYEILLEDKAFPFEDKSIEFYEINLSRIKQGQFNEWIEKSQQKLVELFPVRYNRKPRQDDYVSDYK